MGDTSRRISDWLLSDGKVTLHIHNVCCHCGKTTETDMVVDSFFAPMIERNTKHSCPECAAKIKAGKLADEIAINAEVAICESGIPADFLYWDRSIGNSNLAIAISDNASKSLFVQGHYSSGKSRAVCANLKRQLQRGKSGKFVRFSDIANRYQRTFSNGETEPDRYIDNLLKVDFLVIDDIGKRKITQTAGELLFGILDRIYSGESKCRVWFTSNIAVIDLAGKFDSFDIGDAVVSRIDRMVKENKMAVITA